METTTMIQLKQAMMDVNNNKVSLYFDSTAKYETARELLRQNSRSAGVYNIAANPEDEDPYIHIVFPSFYTTLKFFENNIMQLYSEIPTLYADNDPYCYAEPKLYLCLPEIETPNERPTW